MDGAGVRVVGGCRHPVRRRRRSGDGRAGGSGALAPAARCDRTAIPHSHLAIIAIWGVTASRPASGAAACASVPGCRVPGCVHAESGTRRRRPERRGLGARRAERARGRGGAGCRRLVVGLFLARKRRWMPLAPTPAIVTIALAAVFALSLLPSAHPCSPWEAFLAAGLALLAAASLLDEPCGARRKPLRCGASPPISPRDRSPRREAIFAPPGDALHDPGSKCSIRSRTGDGSIHRRRRRAIPANAVVTPVRRQGARSREWSGAPTVRTTSRRSGRLPSRSTTNDCGPASRCTWPNCAHPACGSSRPAMTSDAASNGTCTTGCSRASSCSSTNWDWRHRRTTTRRDRRSWHASAARRTASPSGLRALARGVFPLRSTISESRRRCSVSPMTRPFPLELSGDAYPRPPQADRAHALSRRRRGAREEMSAPGRSPSPWNAPPTRSPCAPPTHSAAPRRTLRDRVEALGGRVAAHRRRDRGAAAMRVVVADDSLLTREGIVRMLVEAGVDVVAQAADGRELLARVDESRPDVAVIDIKMPPTFTDEGLVAAASVRERYSGCRHPRAVAVPRNGLRDAADRVGAGEHRLSAQGPDRRHRRARRRTSAHP